MTEQRSDERWDPILAMLESIASLDFSQRLPISDNVDSVDAIAAGLNMLSEELEANVVARARLIEREVEKDQLIVELREALDQIRTLRGIVPICASCKNIRDDSGFWQRVEVYVRDHTEVEFSHSLCPECEQKLYREM